MELGIRKKRAWVLASSSGIGKAIAEELVREGARVAISSSNPEKLKATASEIGAELAIPVDLLKPGQTAEACKKLIQEWGGVDILVTNAGGPPKGEFLDISLDDWAEGFQGLYLSVVESMQGVLPGMKERQWGRIILVTSLAAKEPLKKLTVSNGLRSGLLGLMKSLSHEWARHGVTFNSILPGYTATERLKELNVSDAFVQASIPAQRLGRPEEVGALAAFLASEHAGFLNGQSIALDGGQMAGI